MHQWEFTDLSKLLQGQEAQPEEATIITEG